MFTFSFGSAFAMTTVTKNNLTHYEKGDFSYASTDFNTKDGGTKGGIGVTDIELATVTDKLNANVKVLAKDGTYTYITDEPVDGTATPAPTPKYGPKGTTKYDKFHGARLKNVQDLVAATLETVKTAKTSYAIHTALAALDRKVFEETSEDELMAALKKEAKTLDPAVTIANLTSKGSYILPGYGKITNDGTASNGNFYDKEGAAAITNVLPADLSTIDTTKTGTATSANSYNVVLGWFFDNGFETSAQITSTQATRKFEDSLVKIGTEGTESIYAVSTAAPATLTSDGKVLYRQAKALNNALGVTTGIDVDAAYNAVKAYRDFEAANYENADSYTTDNDVLKSAVAYYGGVNFKKYNDIKKMNQSEVLAAKADVVALAEAIVAFEKKFEKKYTELDIYGKGKDYDLTRELGYIEAAGDNALVDAKLALNVSLPKDLKAADKAAFDAYENAYKAYKVEFDKAIYEDVDNMDLSEDTEAFLLAGARNFDVNVKEEAKDTAMVQAYLNNATVKVTTKALGNGKIRVNARIDAQTFEKLLAAMGEGSTVSYKFYQKKANATSFKGPKEKSRNYITYTKASLKKGTKYQFQCGVVIKDKDGKVVAEKSYKASTVGSRVCR